MSLLGAAEIRALAAKLDLKPAKALGQNFVIDANICRKIVKLAGVSATDVALEIGPGLGSLTLGLLDEAATVIAVEIDQRLAQQLPITVKEHSERSANLTVINEDALQVSQLPQEPTVLVANLPYNISVPVLLHYLEKFPSIRSGIVMVQAEVADRLVAKPGSKDYGIPSVKAAWWADMSHGGSVSRSVFWPVPNVDSKLVAFSRHAPLGDENLRLRVFAVIDAAFSQRRKMLRSALKGLLGSSEAAQQVLEKAGIDPTLRGEALVVDQYLQIARATDELGIRF
jgi:16S rRNA (adenine1518-N6/adenine1519-N6)-dimethyltransferase